MIRCFQLLKRERFRWWDVWLQAYQGKKNTVSLETAIVNILDHFHLGVRDPRLNRFEYAYLDRVTVIKSEKL